MRGAGCKSYGVIPALCSDIFDILTEYDIELDQWIKTFKGIKGEMAYMLRTLPRKLGKQMTEEDKRSYIDMMMDMGLSPGASKLTMNEYSLVFVLVQKGNRQAKKLVRQLSYGKGPLVLQPFSFGSNLFYHPYGDVDWGQFNA